MQENSLELKWWVPLLLFLFYFNRDFGLVTFFSQSYLQFIKRKHKKSHYRDVGLIPDVNKDNFFAKFNQTLKRVFHQVSKHLAVS